MMRSKQTFYTLAAASSVLLLLPIAAANAHELIERPIQIKNESGKRTELYWIHPQSGEMVLQTPDSLVNGQTLALNSFVNHTFVVRELPSKKSGTCGEYGHGGSEKYPSPSYSPVCREVYVTVNDHEDQVIHILQDMEIEIEDSTSKSKQDAQSIISKCRNNIDQQISLQKIAPAQAIDIFAECTQPSISDHFQQLHQEIKDQELLRLEMGEQWEDYTCADFDLPTTTPKSTHTWTYHGKDHEVGVLLEKEDAKIHYVKNFITSEECAAIESAAKPRLHQATVADGSGGSHLQKSRKALQAGVRIPWEHEDEGDLIATVSRRLYTYINEVTGYNIEEAGQEDLMSIQYFGRGLDDPAPDRYKPHCDGQCDGLKFQPAGRVATMVMYCEAPIKGGATNFRNVGVHVVPEVGTAAFFSYLDTGTGKVDNRLTEHSCCPVLEGDKKIAVQWLRLGVDKENPWDSFNTLNIKIGEEEL